MSIYKICGYGMTYYGSTRTELNKRLYQHEKAYISFLNGKCRRVTVYDILEKGNDYNITLVEEVNDINELKKREGYYIKNDRCINKCVAGRNKKDYYRDNRGDLIAYQLHYNEINKERISIYYRKYYNDKIKKK